MKQFKKIFITMSLVFILLGSLFNLSIDVQASDTELEDSGISYLEDTKILQNPDRGFYSTMPIMCTPTDTKVQNPKGNLIHLRIGLAAFSKAQNHVEDLDFTDNMLDSLNATFENIRKNGGTAIVRFAYDNFNGIANAEPSMAQIVKHIKQLKPLFEENKDVITTVESGFFGPYGEQHSSKIINTENFKTLLDTLLEVVPIPMTINVRTPKIYANYVGIPLEALKNYTPEKGTSAYRIGIFNDGYLGSETDLGTYHHRENEISWLTKHATHTIFGGEVVANYATNGYVYNSIEHIEKEMYDTHTTYLNKEWNDSVIHNWQQTPYMGVDPIYQGKTAFEYIDNHLGYRFVLRDCKLTKEVKQGTSLQLQCKIENVGAGNIVNTKEVILLLVGEHTYYKKLSLDPSIWYSKQITPITIEHFIDENVLTGDYKLYLKIASPGQSIDDCQRTIQFANSSIWEETLGANFLGNITVIEDSKDSLFNEISNTITNEITNTTNVITNTMINETTNTITNTLTNTVIDNVENSIDTFINVTEKDNTIAPNPLPQTGEKSYFIFSLLFISSIFLFFYSYIKIRNKKLL